MVISKRKIMVMQRVLLRWAIVLAVAVMLIGHVTELFDKWDHTLTTGSDADYSVVLVTACVGLAFVVAKCVISLLRCFDTNERARQELLPLVDEIPSETFDRGLSPPLPLRV